ncbi:excalibur calcium-binding domain-containing protein [Corynebacterium pseudodiphtheriticum]|uniref:excalibur calcium-binding domain-containing protein n=1 Tax=Corynebacterium pseudodiphtheriticum TaxID=37637 RepID=UPI00254F708D|nr:excalibur calcium-binding domain-containing protein [Corynebacterium pseudodiphtheriticum]MDK8499686.1 excalibur calcium-binding domain-containing protein [Corynebacterium pseudodiphtheriticum]MDK8583280.1 excalibur calcium-binding domain-containing protein [Corynebacterium pseudodiphtheriticum]MDK8838911.1 excalibur calcium-binding domain-containing protein [Corynebacterium pseudodiphtheriticum]
MEPAPAPAEAPAPAPAPAPAEAPAPAPSAFYPNCAAARAAGAAPLYRGNPGYSTKLDRDGDGVACEQSP